ncbi:sugar phosphate isomerase/epimerase [Robiginitalea sp. SC105]|nr:sugar phosphate isomerase/epimerase [Robiginitalea sp. SC105]
MGSNPVAYSEPTDVKIGFNLLAWSATVSEDLDPIIERLAGLGFHGVECAMGAREAAAYNRFGERARSLGLGVNCVLAVGPDTNPVSPSAAVREKALDEIRWAIDRAASMDARVICGPFHSAFAHFTGAPPTDQEYGWSAGVLQKAGDHAAQAGITLALEALNRFECYLCNTMDQLTFLVNRVSHPSVQAMFDTHHANMEEKKFATAIAAVSPVLRHVHISENDRGTPGYGHVPWEETFRSLSENRYTGWLTIEAFTRNDPDFANSINVWRNFSPVWEMAEEGLGFIRKMCDAYRLNYR